MISQIIQQAVKAYPDLIPLLTGRARWIAALGYPAEYKSYDDALSRIEQLIRDAYNGKLGTIDFTSGMASILSGQVRNAYNTAWYDMEFGGETSAALPDYLERSLQNFISIASDMQYSYNLYADIIKARQAKTGLDLLLSRAQMWANRWNDAYNEAIKLINSHLGQKLKWIEGDTQDKCDVCVSLNGIVAYASVWEDLGVKPQAAPNSNLTCGGWRCGCYFLPTTERQTRNARDAILRAIGR